MPIRLAPDDPRYPAALPHWLGADAPSFLDAEGNLDLLARPALALLASARCPGRLILQAHDLAQALRRAGATVIGGFHSPVEREALTVLLRGTQPLIVCPARSLARMRLPADYRAPLAAGRLLLLSPFDEREQRATVETAAYRNRLVAALSARVFVAYAAPGGKTETFVHQLLAWGKPVLTLADNRDLLELGAQAIDPTGGWP